MSKLFLVSLIAVASTAIHLRASAQTMFSNGFEPPCDVNDADNDRLSGCQEQLHQTNPYKRDTDDDGLNDGDEVLGTTTGLDLPGLGVSPRRKDILVEHDWTEDAYQCAQHNHKPTEAMLTELRELFASAPLSNPDGSLGINLVNDYGQGGLLVGGNFIALPNGSLHGIQDENYALFKPANFDPDRVGYFRYMLHAHVYTSYFGSVGAAEVPGDEALVTMGCHHHDKPFTKNTILHELGHNLGLRHGGNSDCNYKPNYNSVMNYRFSQFGVDINCDSDGDGVADYSPGTNVAIDESNVDERLGVCGSPPISWNFMDPSDEVGLTLDLNQYGYFNHPQGWQEIECGGLFTVLTDDNDWASLNLLALPAAGSDGGNVPSPEISICHLPLTEETL